MFNQEMHHKWGFKDTNFKINQDKAVICTGNRYEICGHELPNFIPYLETELGINIDNKDRKEEVEYRSIASPNLNQEFYHELQKIFADHQYTFDSEARLIHSHGQTTVDEVYQVLYQKIERLVDLVFYCESEIDVEKIIALAIKYNVCLIPFGGGTNVTCALKIPSTETRMIVSVDMRKMNQIEWIDRENCRASVQAGITGKHLEDKLKKAGFTSGHEPDSYEFSTLGGWIATNASGMKKNRYGNIENIVEQITLITPAGTIEQSPTTPRASMGIQPEKICFGSEGNLGIITKAIIKIYPLPSVQKYGSIIFHNFDQGVKFLYQLAHTNFIPASVRLVDNSQFRFGQSLKPQAKGWKNWLDRFKKWYILKVKKFAVDQMVAVTLVMEGSREEVAYQEKNIYHLAKQFQGVKGGQDNGKRGYMLTFAIAYIRDFLLSLNIIGETFETSVPWSNINQVCSAVKSSLNAQFEQLNLPGKPYLSYRISQIYHTGVCLYFMLGIYSKDVPNADKIFHQIEDNLRQVILENGGSISHHHGVGKIRYKFMDKTQTSASIELLKKIKQSSDPHNIFGVSNNIFFDAK